ncbi:Glycosyltransferase family 1 protein [Vibrio chagasii]|nr:Glycosyltransferase family 1 protein [Vibrio chagasii]
MNKVLIVSDGFMYDLYGGPFYSEFERLGFQVESFIWKDYFKNYQYPSLREDERKNSIIFSFYYRFQNKFIIGPDVARLNNDLINLVNRYKPNLIFVYRGTHILSSTLKKLKETGAIIFGYNNDDPFSKAYPYFFWRHFKSCIPYYDLIYAYRNHNVKDYINAGAKNSRLLRSYYNPSINYVLDDCEKDIDVIFIGHYENDGRDLDILALFKKGLNVKLHGTGWERSSYYEELHSFNGPIFPVYSDYNLMLNRAKIALVFLSKLNRDTYTRRCFEIPASGTLMLSQYTSDLASLYEPGKEAIYFHNSSDLVSSALSILNNNELRLEVTKNGRNRLIKDGHEVSHRVQSIVLDYHLIINSEKDIN